MRIAVMGAAGRMGRALVRAVLSTEGLTLVAALERPGSAALGQDAGSIAGLPGIDVGVTDNLRVLEEAEGILDFTAPAATLAAAAAARPGAVHVVGTTGFTEAEAVALRGYAHRNVIVQSGNMSLGVNVLAALVRRAAAALPVSYDIEIVEMHHRQKVDAPSGTALLLGAAAAEGRGLVLGEASIRARDGHTGARPPGGIGFASLRGGTVVGDHTVILAGAGERIELTHRAESRENFADGALKAVLWGRGRAPGHFDMADVLGLKG